MCIMTQQDTVTNWAVGQRIVLVSTIWKDLEQNQNEVLVIQSIGADRRSITVTSPIGFDHYG